MQTTALFLALYYHYRGGINRIRSMTQQPDVIATWSDTGTIHLTDVSKQIAALEKGGARYVIM
jgi:hypothetical protein